MADIITVDEAGVETLSLTAIEIEVLARFREVFGADFAISAQTPQGQIAGILAVALSEVTEQIAHGGNGTSIYNAGGSQLDALGGLIGRGLASRSRVTVTLRGVSGTSIPAGSRAQTADRAVFRTTADAVLGTGDTAAVMESVEEGAVAAAAGALADIVTVVPGWESVTNAAAAILGQDRQPDAEYRQTIIAQSSRASTGPLDAMRAALDETTATRNRLVENTSDALVVTREWPVGPNAILVVVEGGGDAAVRRAIETHRGMGVGTMSAIRGGPPDDMDLQVVSNGSVEWDGTAYTGLDLTGTSSPAEKATALDALLPATVTVRYTGGRYVAVYRWVPSASPAFDDGTVATAFGFDPVSSTASPGPFIRPRERALAVDLTVTRQDTFPADGFTQIQSALLAVPVGYGLGEEVWLNDFLAAAERIAGTRVSTITVQADGADVSGVTAALDSVWSLDSANITITLT